MTWLASNTNPADKFGANAIANLQNWSKIEQRNAFMACGSIAFGDMLCEDMGAAFGRSSQYTFSWATTSWVLHHERKNAGTVGTLHCNPWYGLLVFTKRNASNDTLQCKFTIPCMLKLCKFTSHSSKSAWPGIPQGPAFSRYEHTNHAAPKVGLRWTEKRGCRNFEPTENKCKGR